MRRWMRPDCQLCALATSAAHLASVTNSVQVGQTPYCFLEALNTRWSRNHPPKVLGPRNGTWRLTKFFCGQRAPSIKSMSIKLFLSINLSSVQRCKHTAAAEASVQRGASCFLTTVVKMNHTTMQRLQGEQTRWILYLLCICRGCCVPCKNT